MHSISKIKDLEPGGNSSYSHSWQVVRRVALSLAPALDGWIPFGKECQRKGYKGPAADDI